MSAEMVDYYDILSQRISDTKDDPARTREVIYEAARLGLKRQVFSLKPAMLAGDAWRHLDELENAIKRLEADAQAADAIERRKREDEAAQTAAALRKREEEAAHAADALRKREAEVAQAAAALRKREEEVAQAAEALRKHQEAAALAEASPSVLPTPTVLDPGEAVPIAAASPPDPPALSESDELDARRMRALEDAILGGRTDAKGVALRKEGEARQPQAIAMTSRPDRVARATPADRHAAKVEAPDAFEKSPTRAMPGTAVPDDASPRDLVVVSDRSVARRPAAYTVNPNDFVNPNVAQRGAQQQPRTGFRPLLVGAAVVSQLVIATLAGVSFYIAMWGRGAPVQTAQNDPAAQPVKPAAAAGKTSATRPAETGTIKTAAAQTAAVETPVAETVPVEAAPVEAAPAEAAPAEATPVETTAVEAAPVEAAPVESAAVTPAASGGVSPGGASPLGASAMPALPFPRPPAYGVYALANNSLIELQRIGTAPVDPRVGNPLKIVAPSRAKMDAPGLAFVIYGPDLVSRAPDLFKVRIAAQLSQSMNYNSVGRAVVTKRRRRRGSFATRVTISARLRCAKAPRW